MNRTIYKISDERLDSIVGGVAQSAVTDKDAMTASGPNTLGPGSNG